MCNAHLEVETRHDRKPLHRQLLGGLLVTMAPAAFDLGAASQVFGSGEPAMQKRESAAIADPAVRCAQVRLYLRKQSVSVVAPLG